MNILGEIKKRRGQILDDLGKETLGRIYEYSDVLYCEPIEKAASEFINEGIWKVYHSWIDEKISDYNTDFYFQPRDYIAACYKKGEVL